MADMTHPDSKFTPFSITLTNSAILTGIKYIPPNSPTASPFRPLVILIHGGSCHAHHFDVDVKHTASVAATHLSIPIVAINRPCYKGTTSLYPIPPTSTFHQETGKWEHRYIFPALWEAYGIPNSCTAIVALGHSLATPGIIVAAALHAQETNPAYPLAGFVASGWGVRNVLHDNSDLSQMTPEQQLEQHQLMMLGDPKLKAVDPEVKQFIPIQRHNMQHDEIKELLDGTWGKYWKSLAHKIEVPIMYGLAEHDWWWEGTAEHAREFETYFPSCPRFDSSIVMGAPHAIEWSHYAQGWYARCFGFALEVTASKAVQS